MPFSASLAEYDDDGGVDIAVHLCYWAAANNNNLSRRERHSELKDASDICQTKIRGPTGEIDRMSIEATLELFRTSGDLRGS